jgi:hypothetical protein
VLLDIQELAANGEWRVERHFFHPFTELVLIRHLKLQKLFDSRIPTDGETHIVTPLAFENALAIGSKKNSILTVLFWTDVNQRAIEVSPNGMKLSFRKNSGPFPNCPAVLHGTARLVDFLSDISEAIRESASRSSRNIDEGGIVYATNFSTQAAYIRRNA